MISTWAAGSVLGDAMRHKVGASSYWGKSECWRSCNRESWLFSGGLAHSGERGLFWSEQWRLGFDISGLFGNGRECSRSGRGCDCAIATLITSRS